MCARGTGVLSCLCAVWADEGWPVFTLSVFLLVFFFIPSSSSSHSAINPNSHLSDQREGWSFSLLIHLQFAHRLCPSVGTSGLGQLPQARSSVPARQLASARHCLGWLAGRARDGWAGLLPCMFLLLEPSMHCVSACPLSQSPLLEWPHARMVHGTEPHPTSAPRPGQLSVPARVQVQEWLWGSLFRGTVKAKVLDLYGGWGKRLVSLPLCRPCLPKRSQNSRRP